MFRKESEKAIHINLLEMGYFANGQHLILRDFVKQSIMIKPVLQRLGAVILAFVAIGVFAEPLPPFLFGAPAPVPGTSTLNAVAFDFRHYVLQNKRKPFTFATYNDDVSYEYTQESDIPNLVWPVRWKQYRWGEGSASGNYVNDGSKGAFSSFTIQSLPVNGTVHLVDPETNGVTDITNTPHTLIDPDQLVYVPNTGFAGTDTLTYSGTDRTGDSSLGTITFEVHAWESYPMPYGIPKPSFGGEEPPPDPAPWPGTESPGSYFVSADDPNCTDSNNTYGYPDQPRCGLPDPISVVSGGKFIIEPASSCYQIRTGFATWTLDGAAGADNGAWVVGAENAAAQPCVTTNAQDVANGSAQREIRFDGSFSYFVGINFDDLYLSWYYNSASGALGPDDNVVYRYTDHHSMRTTGNSSVVTTGGIASNFMFLGGHVHDNQGFNDLTIPELDVHGFTAGDVTGMWVIDAMCTEVTGDCYQSSHGGGVNTNNVYMGRWVAHEFGENCINTKPFSNGVISENDCWSTRSADW